MRAIFLALLLAVPAYAMPGNYVGYAEVERRVHDVLLKPTGVFHLTTYVKQGNPDGGLMELLGTYVDDPTGESFRNGDPNGLSFLVWTVVLRGLSDDLALSCRPGGNLELNPEARAALLPLCRFGQDPGALPSGEELGLIWDLLVGFVAPRSERAAWIGHVWSLGAIAQGDRRVSRALSALLLHPHFLLRAN